MCVFLCACVCACVSFVLFFFVCVVEVFLRFFNERFFSFFLPREFATVSAMLCMLQFCFRAFAGQ